MGNKTKKPRAGKWMRRVFAFVLALAMCIAQSAWGNVTAKAEDASNEFTLYYYAEDAATLYLNIWNHSGITFGTEVTTSSDWGWNNPQGVFEAVSGKDNWYQITVKIVDASANDGMTIYADDSSTVLAQYDNQWNNTTDYVTLVGGSSTEYAIKNWTVYTSLAAATGESTGEEGEGETGDGEEGDSKDETDVAVSGELNITKVANLSDDFIMGMDISSVISEFNSGVVYKDFNGNTIDNVTDFCRFLKSCGITHIRVRVWNDPYDTDGNGYGGGNNDVETAKVIADACIAADLKMLVDFHCSDFWTDPSKQQAPKAWSNFTLEEKADALKEYIYESLNTIDPEKKTVAMVQVGNETTNGFIGESSTENMCTLFRAGAKAVREYNNDAKVVIHVTNPEKSTVTTWAKNLDTYAVDYDVLATSYYPYWHGTLANLKSQFETVKETYGKDVMVAETSYAYTLDDSDGHTNTVRVGNNDTGSDTTEPFTEQGQATAIRNLINAVNEAGGLGVFYWEPAWITVGDTTGLSGDAYDAQVAENKTKWETNGSGWASSYAAEYDPTDAGKWYGGSAVDNEAMFYADGTPTAALHVWEYVKTGSTTENVYVDEIDPNGTLSAAIRAGESYELPTAVTVTYAGDKVEESVEWNADDIAKADTSKKGVYTISGVVTLSKTCTLGAYKGKTTADVTYKLTVNPENLIAEEDAEFDSGANFEISGSGISGIPATDDPYSGTHSMHWWSESATEGAVTYTKQITLSAGSYTFEAKAQGKSGDQVTLSICDTEGNVLAEGTPQTLEGWCEWKTPELHVTLKSEKTVTLKISVAMQDGGWGTADSLYLYEDDAAEDAVIIGETTPEEETPEEETPEEAPGTTPGTTPEETPGEVPGTTPAVTTPAVTAPAVTTPAVTTPEDTKPEDTKPEENDTAAKEPTASTDNKTTESTVNSAATTVTIIGTASGKKTKATLTASAVAQIVAAAGQKDVMITLKVVDSSNNTKYKVKVSAADIAAGKTLTLYKLNTKTGEYVMTANKTCTVTKSGNLVVSLEKKATYVLVNAKTAKEINKKILATVKAEKNSVKVKAGKKIAIALNSKLNKANIKSVTYTTSKKSTATISKRGTLTAKKKGTVTVKAKVTLVNGKTKTVTTKVTVK